MESSSVLVLNQNYEPLNVCNVRRAVVLVLCGKAEIIVASFEPPVWHARSAPELRRRSGRTASSRS